MKSLARLRVWWPDNDSAIETHAKSCTGCATAACPCTLTPVGIATTSLAVSTH